MTSDQALIMRRDNPLDFVANACAALADSVNELRAARVGDHLVERLDQARAGEISIPLLDIADRLHAELVRQPLPV